MSAQWAVGEAEMRRTSHSKRVRAPLQGALATIENAEGRERALADEVRQIVTFVTISWGYKKT